MFDKIFLYFFPIAKTQMELAKEKLLSNNIVINNNETPNPWYDSMFFVGQLRPKKNFPHFDYITILFNYNNTTVAIKQGDTVLYYFKGEKEVNEIREILATILPDKVQVEYV